MKCFVHFSLLTDVLYRKHVGLKSNELDASSCAFRTAVVKSYIEAGSFLFWLGINEMARDVGPALSYKVLCCSLVLILSSIQYLVTGEHSGCAQCGRVQCYCWARYKQIASDSAGRVYANCGCGASRRECNQLVQQLAFFMLLPATTLQECIRGRVYITPGSVLQVRLMAQVLGMYRFTTPLFSSLQTFLNTVLVIRNLNEWDFGRIKICMTLIYWISMHNLYLFIFIKCLTVAVLMCGHVTKTWIKILEDFNFMDSEIKLLYFV